MQSIKSSVLSDSTPKFLQCIPFIMLCLRLMGMDRVISELCYDGQFYKGIIGK